MRLLDVFVAVVAFLPTSFVALPTQAEGFASSTTGGSGGQVVRPKNNQELANYLKDNTARIIYLERTFDFKGSEGSATETGCAPWGTGAHCQLSINKNQWCTNYNPGAQKVTVKYDKAGLNPLMVGSNKSIIGVSSKGVIKGKGLRLANGVKNVIIQNIHITDLNPSLVWGGDAITLDGTDNIWIDHCTTSLIGRQHIVLGTGASGRVSITNNKIDGVSPWSASCNTYHYWAILFLGKSDLITFKGNYMYHVSGRAPKVSSNTLLHVVNNYFHDVFDHAFEIEENGQVLAEGNAFQNVKNPLKTGTKGRLFTVPTAGSASSCKASLGRACQMNAFISSGTFPGDDTGFLGSFKGKTIAYAANAQSAKNAMTKAGCGSSCVGYYDYEGSGDNQTIHWSVLWDIDPNVGTNLVKGYNFIGLTQGLETRLSDIKSIPSKYEWTTSKTTDYKGNVVYDFMTSDTKGDSTTSKAQELMLWLNWEGGQVPIGWGEGPIATIDGLFGKHGWKLYQGVNADTGITVSSLLCPEDGQFGDKDGGSFEGDIKDWLVALSKKGVFKSDTYVNVGNAGMEPYYGTVDFDNHLSLRINV